MYLWGSGGITMIAINLQKQGRGFSYVHEKKVYNMPLQYNPLFCSFTVFVLDQVDDDQVDFNEMLS